MIDTHTAEIRVRYSETDAMGFLHHGNYASYFEEARTDLFRVNGGDYRAMEESGLYFVVVDMSVRFRKPAQYDDVLAVTVTLDAATPARLKHSYRITRGEDLIAQGTTQLAMVNREGKVQRITASVAGVGE
ncbi:MAG: acyl-CoA thioesterase [Planctomycetaceae bacterium]|nr:acyl-CoA thioesterase [Planctomycetaceae bacterium]